MSNDNTDMGVANANALAALVAAKNQVQGTKSIDPVLDDKIAKVVEKKHSPSLVTFYSRGDGSRYCFEDGGIAVFTGGQYEFDPNNIPDDFIAPPARVGLPQVSREDAWKRRYEELKYVCSIPNPVFSNVLVPVHKSDTLVMREVGFSGGGVGIVGSFQAGGNLRQSN